jgi:hypothetical protein
VKRGTSVDIANHGCADEEPEPLAHKLPTLATTFALPATLRSLCDSGGGGRRHRGSGEPRSGEDGKRVAASRPFDIADQGAPGAGRARAQRGRSTARDRCGARGIDERVKRARDQAGRYRRRRRPARRTTDARSAEVGPRGSGYASNGWDVLPLYVPTAVGRPTAFRVQTLETVTTKPET